MNPDYLFERIKGLFNRSGFNIVSRIKSNDYRRRVKHKERSGGFLPYDKSIVLVGFAGKDFWDVLQAFLRNNPDFKNSRIDLIDDYTLLRFKSAAKVLEESNAKYEMIFPFGPGALSLDFLELGRMGGLGVDSLLGILLHPEYGPWISLRGAIITDLVFSDYDNPLEHFTPCPSCPKPCITACPAKTISYRGWDWEACMNFRLSSETCETSCASRRACPYGKEHQYSEEQLAHHHKFVLKSVKQYWKGRT